MGSFSLLREDRFSNVMFESDSSGSQGHFLNDDSQKSVRRPLLGMGHKEERYAVIRVVSSLGGPLDIYNTSAPQQDEDKSDSSATMASYSSNILIQTIQENREEKSQIIQTFGDDFVYFFGERPVQISVSAVLLDSNNFRWHQEWWANYESYFRGTELVRRDARVYLEVQDVMYEGYIMSSTTSKSSDSPRSVALNFRLLVTNKIFLSPLRNRYQKVDLISRDNIETVVRDAVSSNFSLQIKMAENSLVGLRHFMKRVKTGLPPLTENQTLDLETALTYVDPGGLTGEAIMKSPSERIKQLTELYTKLHDLVIESFEKPYYDTSIDEYPNRGVKADVADTKSKISIKPSEFISVQRRSRASFGTRFPAAVKSKPGFELETKYSLGSVVANLPATSIGDTEDLDISKLQDGLWKRGVHSTSVDLSSMEGKKSFLAGIDDLIGDVNNFLGTVAQLGVFAANAYLAFTAGKSLLTSLLSSGSFEGSVLKEPITFEETRVASQDQVLTNPSGGAVNFDPNENPTPFRSAGQLQESEESEIIFVQPDFSIFGDSGSAPAEVIILE